MKHRWGSLQRSGFVYFIRFIGEKYIKIGLTTREPKVRLQQLKRQYKHPLEILHVIKTDNAAETEKAFHSEFKSKNVINEWFELTEEDIKEIKGIEKI